MDDTKNTEHILVFNNQGKIFHRRGNKCPTPEKKDFNEVVTLFLDMEANTEDVASFSTKEFRDDEYAVLVTKKGMVKRMRMATLRTNRVGGITVMPLEEDDKVIKVLRTTGSDNILIATTQGKLICFDEQDIFAAGRASKGVHGITLNAEDAVVAAEKAEDGKMLLTVTKNGYGRRTELSELLRMNASGERVPQSRGGKGMKSYDVTETTGPVIGCRVVDDSDELIVAEDGGIVISIPVDSVKVGHRDSHGASIIALGPDDKVGRIHLRKEIPEA